MQDANVVFNQAIAHMQQGEWQKAEPFLDALAETAIDNPNVLVNLGICEANLNRPGVAIALLSYACALAPDDAGPLVNLGATFIGGIHRDVKRRALIRAAEIDPKHADAWGNLSGTYVQDGDPDPGIEAAQRCVALEPDHASAHNNLGLLYLEKGEWVTGWHHWRWRKKMAQWHGRPTYTAPEWDGTPVASLLVRGEQGIGDEVMFLSYLDLLLARVSNRLVLEVNPKLVPLVRRSLIDPRLEVIGTEAEFTGTVDAQCCLGDLPELLDQMVPPQRSHYLQPDVSRVRHWQQWLAAHGPRPWVAFGLHGGTKASHEYVRNCAPDEWRPVIDAAGSAYSIQYGPSGPRRSAEAGIPLLHIPANDLMEQAAFIAACDVLVSVPQTALHLAGATGQRVFGVISDKPAWRYGLKGPMPWYSPEVVRLFRMAPGEKWRPVMERVASAVKELAP
ncbi:MAG: hypothetical protein RLZZ393_849 [Pseudomonadota bacterium]